MMLTISALLVLAVFFGTIANMIQALTINGISPARPPFEFLFAGSVTMGDLNTFEGPSDTRMMVPFVNGTFYDGNGDIVARLVPGNSIEHGYVAQSGIMFTDIVWTVQWEKDGKLAYLRAVGVGKLFDQDLNYVHLETDSEVYGDLNRRFILANGSFPPDHAPPFISFWAAPSAF